ncbi:1-acyl-sn-glycerol-3-phosphate acyltransferase [Malonomonas rubra DSM 5091]|uniref:1-acyl-sn-glycerol-3-phosphate acyltransferase n=1 Tax=Malonomonas rubra DSM 5091 TaxID=1122189 RepID=A0A1M6I7Y4_MALRU|nr:lysophospholipid acyltransferase family protein [Malonomonas rubra]SHJ30581.1 1-acyl-sn-glycerol-3-phosphate acyltransferase [Malonomonas rubra DSM 5091]
MLRTLFFYLTYYPWTFIVLLLALPLSLLGQNHVHRLGILWGRSALFCAGLKITVKGSENIPRDQPVVYIVNHSSNFDIPVLYAGLPLQFRWMAKKELFDVPLFGLAMRRCGYIPIDRSDRRKAMHSMNDAAKQIQAGASVIIFPEGTRTPDGHLQEFKKGGFLIAIKAQVPIVPVAITGSFNVMSKDSLRINKSDIEMEIFPPITTEGLKNAETKQLMAQVREPIFEKTERGQE